MKLGLFGGTFDPPHSGHLIVAQDAWAGLGLDRVVFIPAGIPPHKRKRPITPGGIRLAMLRAAVAGDPHFDVDDLELLRKGPSYTVDTLRTFREHQPEADLHLLMGADQYADFETWYKPAEIRRLARIVVMARAGEAADGSSIRVPVTRVDVSGTEIRHRIANGRPVRYLVPDAVLKIIEREHLYRSAVPQE
jgi:nicotinate-nucleotide adenylyltransferase